VAPAASARVTIASATLRAFGSQQHARRPLQSGPAIGSCPPSSTFQPWPNRVEIRSYGRVFNEIADEYDRHRPAYPDALINRACEVAGLAPGARVLEIGCGTDKLTRSLLVGGLRVMAVEPGEQLIARARDQLAGAGEVQFVNARLEEASLPRAHYRAVFSASAIHWVDPDVSWRTIADALVEGGTVAFVSLLRAGGPAHCR
jgi:SAM-dependent methyltransferase